MTKQDDLAYCFAGFELQPGERRLVQAGEPVGLTPKAFEILQYLVERAGHVVAKDELLAAIWPGRFVLESNLTKHIWTPCQRSSKSMQSIRLQSTPEYPSLARRHSQRR